MRALVLFSGGLDSTTCLARAIEDCGRDNVIALTMFYGQRHRKEIEAAKKITDFYGCEWKQLNVEEIFEGSDCSLLTASNNELPMESYEDQLRKTHGKPVSTYVPFRNGLFLGIAASIALNRKCERIYYGIHLDDAAGNAYPDCSVRFAEYMNKAVIEGTGKAVKLYAPYVTKTKADIVADGLSLSVPYELTWSCYNGEEKPCGKCGTCIDRQKAFEKNGITDPLITKEE